ncbi:MAG: hypothetical protein ACPLRS_05040 [Hydrogenobacter sp.]
MLSEALELPERIAKRKSKRLVVAFDDFGDIYKTNLTAVKLFRSFFWGFGIIMELRGLELEDTIAYL